MALRHGIVTISQELTLAPTLTVAENIFIGRLPRSLGRIDWRRLRRDARPFWTTSASMSRRWRSSTR
jgi:ABC-type sugar transport system ATPase subunit